MNNRTSFMLLTVLTIIGATTMSSAYAEQQAFVKDILTDVRITANEELLKDMPISVWTDKTNYEHNDTIMVTGQVANVASGFPVTVTVVSPLNSIVTIDQIMVADDSTFETTLNTAGAMWKYDGTYTIKVNYGSAEKSNSAKVELTGGVEYTPKYATDEPTKQCRVNEITASGQCIPFSISGGTITSATLKSGDNGSIIININAEDNGTLTVIPSKTIVDDMFMVLIDGEECDEQECMIVGNKATIMFPVGAETIEIVAIHVIPEFGTIAAMILAVAIVSIIAVSAKSRLSIMPRY